MIPIQPISTRLSEEQRDKLNDLVAWLNWSESDIMRYSLVSIHEIVSQDADGKMPVMIRMAREGRRTPIGIRNKPRNSP
jgi:hypothetical protein